MKRKAIKKGPDRARIGRASKAKGSSFEREVCKKLSLWVSNGKRDDLYWRSAMSGGRATVKSKRGSAALSHVAGDICAVQSEGEVLTNIFFIECKHYKDLAFMGFLLKDTGLLAAFWEKALAQAVTHGKTPLVIAKQNLWDALVLVRSRVAFRVQPIITLEQREISIYLLSDLISSSFPFRKRISL